MKKTTKPANKTVKAAKKPARRTVKKIVKAGHGTAAAGTKPGMKNPSADFTKKELGEIRARLDEMRGNLSKNVEDKKNLDLLEPEVGDSIDQATQSLDKEILFELSDNERKTLDNIDAALRKLDNEIYGICEHCKRKIEKKRLKALPSARYCLPCQSGAEKSRQ